MARFGIEGLDHVAIAVGDVDRSVRFYRDVLGFDRAHPAWDVPVVMVAGGTGVAIFDRSLHPSAAPDDGEPPEVRILHIAFRVGRAGLDEARDVLAREGVEVSSSDHGIAHSIYFKDPDGHQLELTTYEV